MLNKSGGIICEFTITRLAGDRFLLISAAAALWHDEDWLRTHPPQDGSVRIEDKSGRYGTLVLAGPKARDVLSVITEANMSNNAFLWLTAQEIEIGMARMLALRVNYVGEIGWELHVPVEYMVHVYELLWAVGKAYGIVDFGAYAMESLRLEKCYRAWKIDLTHEYTPAMASLDRFVNLAKPKFIGREALLREKVSGPAERFVPLIVEARDTDTPPCASVFHNGEIVGLVTSGGYGHTIGKSIALAYMRPDLAAPGTEVEVGILGERVKAQVAAEPLFDPRTKS
jgi:dimethylglycine dehydrogenase